MSEEDEKLQKHLIDEMMKVSKTNPDVMIYMGILMKNYEKLEEEIKRLNSTINKIKSIIYNSFEYNALTKVALIRESLQGSDKE